MTDCAACSLGQITDQPHTCEAPIDVLFVAPELFHRIPQVGRPLEMSFRQLGLALSAPVEGDRKDVAGAYSPALYRENVRRKSSLIHVACLVIDIDEGGIVRKMADVFGKYSAIIHSTFSSTPEAPRCRVILELAKPIEVATYDKLHAHFRKRLLVKGGIIADEGAKDASRLSYMPVMRPGMAQETAILSGAPVDGAGIVKRLPVEPPRPPPVIIPPDHRNAYIQGALRKAASNVAASADGLRHYTLAREAWGLARLNIREAEIEGALLGPFVAAAGEPRRGEGVRTIRGQVNDRNGRT